MSDNIRVHTVIIGKVQGVFYRASTENEALRLGLSGWVRNLADGSVEAVFEGSRANVEKMLAWCGQGPPRARVAAVRTREEAATGEFEGFETLYR